VADWRQYLPSDEAPAAAAGVDWQKYLPPEPGNVEAILRGLKQGVTFGFGDELTGLAESAFSDKTYKQSRDEARANDAAAEEAHPVLYGGGELGGGLATTLATGGLAGGAAAGLRGAALAGAAYGAGSSEADLTEGDIGGLARDTAIGASAGALAHGAVGLATRGAKALAPKAREALEKYGRSETEDLFGGAAKSAVGRAALGAGAGAYSGDEDKVGAALKGAALGAAVPAAHRVATKALKKAILAALERGGAKEAAQVARSFAAAEAPAAAAAAGQAAAPVTTETALARVVKATKAGELTPELVEQAQVAGVPERTLARLQGVSERLALAPSEYTPPGAARALEGAPERLALGPVPEAPPAPAKPAKVKLGVRMATPDELAGATFNGAPLEEAGLDLTNMRQAPDLGAIRDAKAKPVTVAVSPKGVMDVVDGRHRILVARERGEPLRVKFVRGAKGLDAAPEAAAAPVADAEAGPATAATAVAVAEFKDAVGKANRLAASGDKMRAQLWLKAAEKKFKTAMAETR
jgi:hypothetical protein